MSSTIGAVLRGVAKGLAVGIAVGALTTIAFQIAHRPGREGDTAERARALGDSISHGMHWAELTILVLVPTFVITRVRRLKQSAD